jgi:hypothetical protein
MSFFLCQAEQWNVISCMFNLNLFSYVLIPLQYCTFLLVIFLYKSSVNDHIQMVMLRVLIKMDGFSEHGQKKQGLAWSTFSHFTPSMKSGS